MIRQPYESTNNGFCVYVYLTPQARQERCAGLFVDANGQAYIKAYVRAAPENNKANNTLVYLVANELGIPPSAVEVMSGHQGRRKKLRIYNQEDRVGQALAAMAES